MTYQSTFKRYEFKYILESAQKLALMDALEGRMKIDSYGRTTIRNIYFDTDNFRLIRLSLDKPSYKEKLRVRSYKKIENDDEVFVELKTLLDKAEMDHYLYYMVMIHLFFINYTDYCAVVELSSAFFFPVIIATTASTALIKHHPDQIAKSE